MREAKCDLRPPLPLGLPLGEGSGGTQGDSSHHKGADDRLKTMTLNAAEFIRRFLRIVRWRGCERRLFAGSSLARRYSARASAFGLPGAGVALGASLSMQTIVRSVTGFAA